MNHDKAADPLAQELIKSRVALRNRLAEKAQIPHIKRTSNKFTGIFLIAAYLTYKVMFAESELKDPLPVASDLMAINSAMSSQSTTKSQ